MITNFKNNTNPDATPISGDVVSFTVNGRPQLVSWDMNVLQQLLKVSNERKEITKLEFRRLFPQSTLVKIDNFEFDESLSVEVKQQLRNVKASFDIAQDIDLMDAEIAQALNFYISIGFMTEAEKETVLTGGIG